MNHFKTIAGVCWLCALVVSAFAAQGASASKGTTAFTCVKGAGTLKGEHCLIDGTAPAEYGHVAIAQDKTTEVITTSEKTEENTTKSRPARLKMTVAGVATELESSASEAEGWMENTVEPLEKGEHYVIAHTSNTFTNVKVAKPAGKGCKVYTDSGTKREEGVIHTEPLKVTTTGEGDNGKLEPTVAGSAITHFIIDGCEGEALKNLNQTYTVEGSITCPVSGTTVNCNHAQITSAGSLVLNGSISAGLELSTTFKGREKGSTGAYTPVSATTVET